MPIVEVTLEACEIMELFEKPTPHDLWLRREVDDYWPMITLRGEDIVVWQYIKENWDEDVADQMVFKTGPLAK